MNETPLRFAVFAEDTALAVLLPDAFRDAGVGADLALRIDATLEDAIEHVGRLRWAGAQILVAQVGDDLGSTVDSLRRVADEAPGTTLMLAGPSLPADALLKVMRAGAVEYLPDPVTPEDLAEAVKRVVSRRSVLTGQVHREGRTMAVFGAKGGSGVTTTAVNLALEIAALTGESTLLVDLDLLDGGAEMLLDLRPRYTIADVIGGFHRLDEGLLKSFVLTHPSGLDVLAAPRTAMEGEKVSPDQAVRLVRVLKAHYARVVMDVGNLLTSVALSVLSEADDLVMVLTPHIECLRNAKRVAAALSQKDARLQKDTYLAVNRFVPDPPIAISEIERALGSSVRSLLPLDDAMMRRSACGGHPSALGAPSKFGKQMRAMAQAAAHLEPSPNGAGFVRSVLKSFLHRNGKRSPAARHQRTPAGR